MILKTKRDRTDARYSRQQPTTDDDTHADYQAFLTGQPLPGRNNG